MQFVCLGYLDEKRWDALSEKERETGMEECLAYDELLKRNGHFVAGHALTSVKEGVSLEWRNGKVAVTDGPFAETKEQLGGILVLEARDLKHAVELMSKHPGVRVGGHFEIRPSDEAITQRANMR